MKLARDIKFSGFSFPWGFAGFRKDEGSGAGRKQIFRSGGAAKASTLVIIDGDKIDPFVKAEALDGCFYPIGERLSLIKVAGIPPHLGLKHNLGRHAKNITGTPDYLSSEKNAVNAPNYAARGIIQGYVHATQIKGLFKRFKGFLGGLKTAVFPCFLEDFEKCQSY
jgi:hypothetical protein